MIHQFERDPESGMILVDILLDEKYRFKMALDTGASRTTFDFNALYLAEYPIGNVEKGIVETAGGLMEVDIFETSVISAFGHAVHGADVQVYDFLAHGILSDYEGVLGLDFFDNIEFRINMKNQTIEVNKM
jgi:hypothetical protein